MSSRLTRALQLPEAGSGKRKWPQSQLAWRQPAVSQRCGVAVVVMMTPFLLQGSAVKRLAVVVTSDTWGSEAAVEVPGNRRVYDLKGV
jgi:hypothetical protein